MTNFNQNSVTIQHWMECYNVTGQLDDDYPLEVNILESEGTRIMEGLGISSNQFLNPLKVKKVNIGSPKYPKFVNIGDYWDDEIVAKITNLLHTF